MTLHLTNPTRRLIVTLLAIFSIVATALPTALLLPAQAVEDDGVFEVADADALDAGAVPGEDWGSIWLQPESSTAEAISFVTDTAPDGNYFQTGGSKDTNDVSEWRWNSSKGGIPDKDEISHAFAAGYDTADGIQVYFGMDRYAGDGSASIGFWFLQNDVSLVPGAPLGTFGASHEVGDILVLSDFTQGGNVSVIRVFKWVGGSNPLQEISGGDRGDCAVPLAPASDYEACATVNDVEADSPWAYTPKSGTANKFPPGHFFEGGINITRLIPGFAGCFSSFVAETRSSHSTESQLHDFALGRFDLCSIDVTKTGPAKSKVGDATPFSVTIENTGSATVHRQSITDNYAGDLVANHTTSDCGTSLAAGASCTITYTYTPQSGDPDQLVNTVSVLYTENPDGTGAQLSVGDSWTVDLFTPSISVVKSSTATETRVGHSAPYKVRITNTSSPDSPALVFDEVDDTLAGDLLDPDNGAVTDDGCGTVGSTLSVGAWCEIAYTHTVTSVDGDPVVNQVYARTHPADVGSMTFDNIVDGTSSVSLPVRAPAIKIEKFVRVYDGGWLDADTTASGPEVKVGDPVDFRFVISNDGDATLTNLQLSDTDFSGFTGSDFSTACSIPTSLAPEGQSGDSYECYYRQASATLGQHSNTATAAGTFLGLEVTDTDPAHYWGGDPAIQVVKEVSVDGGTSWFDANTAATGPYVGVGDPVVFRFTVRNTGNVALSNLDLTDTDFSGFTNSDLTTACSIPATLSPEDQTGDRYTCYYRQASATAGQHSNTATATGDFLTYTVDDDDPAHYYGADPSIDVEKYVSVDGGLSWHDADEPRGPDALDASTVLFRFVVTNDGNVDLTNVSLSDSDFTGFTKADLSTACDIPATFTVDSSFTCFISATAAEGQHENTARAQGDFQQQTVSDTDEAHYFGAVPAIDLEKYVSVDGGTTWHDADLQADAPEVLVGEAIRFRFVIKNLGNVELTSIDVTDWDLVADQELFGVAACSLPASLAPDDDAPGGDDEVECEIDDVAISGLQGDDATAVGTYGGAVHDDEDPAWYFGAAPDIDVEKEVSVDGGATWHDADDPTGPQVLVGQDVQFRFTVINTGNITLTDLTLSDTDFDTSTCAIPTSLAPEGTFNCTIPTTAVAGQHANTATATGDVLDTTVDDEDDAHYYGADPSIDVEKIADPQSANVGDTVTYTYTVTNTGNVTLTDVTAEDDILGTITLTETTLAPGASTLGTATHTVTEADLPGPIVNVVIATGTPPVGPPLTATDGEVVDLTSDPAIELVKTAEIEPTVDGLKIINCNSTGCPDTTFTFTVTNVGDVTLHDVTVTDDEFGPITLADTELEVGESTTGTATYVPNEEEIVVGFHRNLGTASGVSPDGRTVKDTDPERVEIIKVLPNVIERPEPPPAPAPEPAPLPRTGTDVAWMSLTALLALLLGWSMVWLGRRCEIEDQA